MPQSGREVPMAATPLHAFSSGCPCCMPRPGFLPAAGSGSGGLIVDCHGHYATEPKELLDWRKRQIDAVKDPSQTPSRASLKISDDQLRESVEGAQLKLQRERGTAVTIFSPRASGMGHHIGDAATSLAWSRVSNDLIHRLVTLYPKNFVGVCQLPQTPGVSPAN